MNKTLLSIVLTGSIAAVTATSSVSAQASSGQDWPNRPITIILPTAAGGAADTLIRSLADKLSQRLGQSFIVDNKGGASGIVGLQAAARAAPDGYTFVIGWPSSIVATQFLYKDLPFNAKRDFVPVSLLSVNEMMLTVNASVPVNNAKELVAWARENQGKVSYGSYGPGSYAHLAQSYLSKQQDLAAVHVPYKGEMPMLMATAANEVAFSVGVAPTAKRLQDTGKVRMIGIFSPQRSKIHPDVPTVMESGFPDPVYTVAGWYAVFAPAGTPPDIVSKMEKAVIHVMHQPETQASLSSLGMPLIGSTAKELQTAWDTEIPIYKKLFESADIERQ